MARPTGTKLLQIRDGSVAILLSSQCKARPFTAITRRTGSWSSAGVIWSTSWGGRKRGRWAEGRARWRCTLGARDAAAPTILLTALIHGVELIGSIALHEAIAALGRAAGLVLAAARLVVMPIVNPDGLAANMDRLARGK